MEWVIDGLLVLVGLVLGWTVIPKPAFLGSLWAHNKNTVAALVTAVKNDATARAKQIANSL